MQNTEDNYFRALTKRALERRFGGLNPVQREAVFHVDGPLLILAGAGSGKTTVLVNRVENMILFGDAYNRGKPQGAAEETALLERYIEGAEADTSALAGAVAVCPVRPWNILCITFTNKAAGELKARLERKLGEETASDLTACTFHSLCVRILRRECEALGYPKGFAIYDADDSLRVVKQCLKQLNLSDKLYPPRRVLNMISGFKDKLVTPENAPEGSDQSLREAHKIYGLYQKTLKDSGAMDFDDLILQTVRLLEGFPEARDRYRGRYRYVMVDEYQDTSHAQFELIRLLAGGHKNLAVVGDDDQSIYKFRGATIENILSFEDSFRAKTVRLEQNYRSTGHILDAANAIIANNTARKGKKLWTALGEGERLKVVRVRDEEAESRLIADRILDNVSAGGKFSDHGVLYRKNAQSGALEQALARSAIPYRIIGGVRFYERKEIKDMTAYLAILVNPADNLRLLRIINEPKRQIGPSTLSSAREIADGLGASLFSVLRDAGSFAALEKKQAALTGFVSLIEGLAALAGENIPLDGLLEEILERTGYRRMLEAEGVEGEGRMENILELKSTLMRYQEENPGGDLAGFLEEIALYTDLDSYAPSADAVVLMTIHAAKGLEFEHVFLAGMEEGIFPGRAIAINPGEIEEERRLCYVAVTRAKKRLTITSASRRTFFGKTEYCIPSRFLDELPKENAECSDLSASAAANAHAQRALRHGRDALAPPRERKGGGIGIGTGPKASAAQSFSPGDEVSHNTWGRGVIISANAMGGDTLLEIDFYGGEKKKIMANYARLEKR
ncbi:MAG: UvrD-helicase domain-containing protein [Oscillospiraceae bacterium]|nr:UvrD-helicase domain-containing protein [Oscillospiraceae bacterium]